MGIQMNYAYASMLTGVDLDNELRANAKKYRLGFTYETKPLPGQTALTREEAAAKLAAEKENAKKNNSDFGLIVNIIIFGLIFLDAFAKLCAVNY